jgi:hypothetical protein
MGKIKKLPTSETVNLSAIRRITLANHQDVSNATNPMLQKTVQNLLAHHQNVSTAAVNIQQTSQDAPGISNNFTTTSRPLISISNQHVNGNPLYPHPNTNNPSFLHYGPLPHRPAHHKLGPKSHPKHRKLQIINHSVQPLTL